MLKKAFEWSDRSIVNAFFAWLVVLSFLYILAIPIYLLLALSLFIHLMSGGIFIDIFENRREINFIRSLIGFAVAFCIVSYIGYKYVGMVRWWNIFS